MLTLNLAIGGAAGIETFLDQPLESFSTLILQGEIHLRGVYERASSMVALLSKGLSLPASTTNRIMVIEERGISLANNEAWMEFLALCRWLGPGLVIIDPLAHCLTQNENDNAIVGAMLQRLAILRDDPGCAVLLVHHDSKHSGDALSSRSPQQAARGADRLNADPDCILSLVPQATHQLGPASRLHVATRYGRSLKPFNVVLNESTLWFERYIGEQDLEHLGVLVGDKMIDRPALRALIEEHWNLGEDKQHRAADRRIDKALEAGIINLHVVAGHELYAKGEVK